MPKSYRSYRSSTGRRLLTRATTPSDNDRFHERSGTLWNFMMDLMEWNNYAYDQFSRQHTPDYMYQMRQIRGRMTDF